MTLQYTLYNILLKKDFKNSSFCKNLTLISSFKISKNIKLIVFRLIFRVFIGKKWVY